MDSWQETWRNLTLKVGKGCKIFFKFLEFNVIVIVPVLFWLHDQKKYALISFLLLGSYEIWLLYRMKDVWLTPSLYQLQTALFGKPLLRELWTDEEIRMLKKAKWKWHWRLPDVSKNAKSIPDSKADQEDSKNYQAMSGRTKKEGAI